LACLVPGLGPPGPAAFFLGPIVAGAGEERCDELLGLFGHLSRTKPLWADCGETFGKSDSDLLPHATVAKKRPSLRLWKGLLEKFLSTSFLPIHVIVRLRYLPIMSEMEQDLGQTKATASAAEQTTTAEKRNACESGRDLQLYVMILTWTSHSHRASLVPK
jgi:hypothetical protein